jgi:hypothetical protein
LVLVGAGFRKPENGGTEVHGGFELAPFSSNGSTIQCFRIVDPNSTSSVLLLLNATKNCVISNNYVFGYTQIVGNSSEDTLRNNILTCSGFNDRLIIIDASHDIVINNNVLYNISPPGTNYHASISIQSPVGTLHIYNNFLYAASDGVATVSTSNNTLFLYSNIFYGMSRITDDSSPAGLFSYNLLYDVNPSSIKPSNGSNNVVTQSNPFIKFSGSFIYNDDPENDSDFHLINNPANPAIDGGHPPMAPISSDYLDLLGNGGLGSSTADASIYGGPYPFPDPPGAPAVPIVTSIQVDKNPVNPGDNIILQVQGQIGSFPGKNRK